MKKYPEDNRQRPHTKLKAIVGILLIIGVGFLLAYITIPIFQHTNDNTVTISIASAIIALISLLYTYLTYTTIDSVNKLSRMDGNVLENENYITEFSVIVLRYRENSNKEILDHVKHTFQKPLKIRNISGAKLSDSLQEIIDVMRPLAFMLNNISKDKNEKKQKSNREKIEEELSNTINRIEKKVDSFYDTSDGSTKLMRETVKLIKGVLYYQRYRSDESIDKSVELLKVNSSILKNKASLSLYYNYRGLTYYNGAIDIIKKAIYNTPETKTHDLFDIETLRTLPEKISTALSENRFKEFDMVMMNLEEAIKYHRKALSLIGNDPLGNAYIQYDLARAQYLVRHISLQHTSTPNIEWRKAMNKAIFHRHRLFLTATDITHARFKEENKENTGETYIVRGYKFQWSKAVEMKALLEITLNQPITDNYNREIAHPPSYRPNITEELGATDRIDGFNEKRKFKSFIDNYLKESQQKNNQPEPPSPQC